jgi:polyisoprenyl-teichoic acid--peptidoglycan teichoic acid transferase
MKSMWKIAISILIVLTVTSGVFLYFVFSKIGAFFDDTYHPIETSIKNELHEKTVEGDVDVDQAIHILLMGVDERENDKGRPDVLMVAELNPKTNQTKIVSLPRDTKVKIPGMNKTTKLNHSYTYGDVPLTVQTVQQLLDISVDYYAKVNMNGFEEIVRELGPLKVQNKREFTYDGHHFPEGNIELDQDEVLSYVRMRKDDPLGGEGRNIRQRQVIEAGIGKIIGEKDFVEALGFLEKISPYLQWNIQGKDLKTLYTNYLPSLKSIKQEELPGEGSLEEDGLWYFRAEEPTSVFQ